MTLTSRLPPIFSALGATLAKLRWRRAALYTAFGLFCLVVSLFVTFPYEAIQQRIEMEAARSGLTVKLGSLGPAFLGVTATRVQIAAAKPEEEAAEPLLLSYVTVRPTFFPPGVRFKAGALGGTITGALGQGSKQSIELDLDGLDPSQGNFGAFTGLSLSGKLAGHLSLTMPWVTPPGSKVKIADLSQADGELSLDGSGLAVNGGTVKVPMGGTPMPIDLPKTDLGNLVVKIGFAKGLGTVDTLRASGGDLDLTANGTLKLARKVDYSEPNLDLKLRVNPDTVKRLGIMGSGLSLLPSDRSDPSTKSAHLSGYLSKPRFVPGSRN